MPRWLWLALALGCGSPPNADSVDASVEADGQGDASSDADACASICGRPCPKFSSTTPHGTPEGGVCTPSQLDGFYASCFAPQDGGDGGCGAFASANASCAACLVTDESAGAWGAVVRQGGGTLHRVNVPGCLGKTSTDPTCEQRAWDAWACAEWYCTDVCQVPLVEGDSVSVAAHLKCVQDARKGFCRPQVSAECLAADAGPTAACAGDDFATTYRNVAKVLCGTAQGDAGAD